MNEDNSPDRLLARGLSELFKTVDVQKIAVRIDGQAVEITGWDLDYSTAIVTINATSTTTHE